MIARCIECRGQMTVELCVIFPIAIIIAVILVNAIAFFGYCSEFDRVSRNAVRVVASTTQANQGAGDRVNEIKSLITESVCAENVSCEVDVTTDSNGFERYKATLRYWPTLFGMSFRSSVFGVHLPSLSHTSNLTVNPYKPGKFF